MDLGQEKAENSKISLSRSSGSAGFKSQPLADSAIGRFWSRGGDADISFEWLFAEDEARGFYKGTTPEIV
jgi:hypothetical protein